MKRNDPRHGSIAGHRAHRKDGEPPCVACRTAKRDYERERTKRIDRDRTNYTVRGYSEEDGLGVGYWKLGEGRVQRWVDLEVAS